MSVIDLEEYKDIQHQITLDYQKELATEEGHKQGVEQGIEKGIEQGIEKGIKQGIEQGKEQGILLSAQKMINSGMSKEEVAKILDIDIEKIK